MEEDGEDYIPVDYPIPDDFPICRCFLQGEPSVHEEIITARKEYVLGTVTRSEAYLRERRIPELIRFLLTKLISQAPSKPVAYLERLIDDCMLFRAGHGPVPALYESRHFEAVIKSFDPCNRGWLSAGQVRRLFVTLGFTLDEVHEEKISNEIVLKNLIKAQENELYSLLSAGMLTEDSSEELSNASSNGTTK
ncbi:unnamed protein product [Leptidea sinapis]|uniref:EF-hand domain-containing protein n=1 Tax=Leptidea sinapis TaxID=189913 RepID=A0A5E4Q412_9NEOP|nr:unnamed protein product [Leptidea sinapis]